VGHYCRESIIVFLSEEKEKKKKKQKHAKLVFIIYFGNLGVFLFLTLQQHHNLYNTLVL